MKPSMTPAQTPQYVIEGIIFRRLHERRIEGFTIETAKEIAEALLSTPSASAGPQAEAVREALEKIAGVREYSSEDHEAAVRYKRDQGLWTTDEYLADVALASLAHPKPQQADGRGATEINIEGIIGDCVSIDALPWKNDDGSPALLNRIIGIHEAANQIRAALQQSDGPAK